MRKAEEELGELEAKLNENLRRNIEHILSDAKIFLLQGCPKNSIEGFLCTLQCHGAVSDPSGLCSRWEFD